LRSGNDLIELIANPGDRAAGNQMRCDKAVTNLRIDVSQFRVGVNHLEANLAKDFIAFLDAEFHWRAVESAMLCSNDLTFTA
jgi:hypothetical protein